MKRVLVTGGSRGLGLALCERLLEEGYQVITASRKISPALGGLLQAHPGQIEFHEADFSQSDGVQLLAKKARILDGLHGFVANAGAGSEGLFVLTPESELARCFQVNLLSPILLAREVVKGMLKQGGSLIFISSVAAKTGFSGLAAYSAAKGALLSFSRTLAREYGEKGIRSNTIVPGFLETEMTENLGDELKDRIARRTAMKRLGRVEDVVGSILFLLSEEARFISGTELVVDGGMLA